MSLFERRRRPAGPLLFSSFLLLERAGLLRAFDAFLNAVWGLFFFFSFEIVKTEKGEEEKMKRYNREGEEGKTRHGRCLSTLSPSLFLFLSFISIFDFCLHKQGQCSGVWVGGGARGQFCRYMASEIVVDSDKVRAEREKRAGEGKGRGSREKIRGARRNAASKFCCFRCCFRCLGVAKAERDHFLSFPSPLRPFEI